MPALDLPVKVEVEVAIHKSVQAFCEKVYREHGLRIDHINIEWENVSTLEEPQFRLKEALVATISNDLER